MGMARDTMIWVVDDDPELRKMVGTYLIDQGYDVRSRCDVKQFEARLECQRPDLVVLDLMLPGDDGLTALRRLRDAGDDLPVVMLTARAVTRAKSNDNSTPFWERTAPFCTRSVMVPAVRS